MEKRVSFGCEGVARATWLEILLVPKIKQKKRGKVGKQKEREREREIMIKDTSTRRCRIDKQKMA